jgi:hypothetical protein
MNSSTSSRNILNISVFLSPIWCLYKTYLENDTSLLFLYSFFSSLLGRILGLHKRMPSNPIGAVDFSAAHPSYLVFPYVIQSLPWAVIDTELIKKFPNFIALKCLFSSSQKPVIDSYDTVQLQGIFWYQFNILVFMVILCPAPSMETLPCQLLMTAYSIHLQLSTESGYCFLPSQSVFWGHFALDIALRFIWSLCHAMFLSCSSLVSKETNYRISGQVSAPNRTLEFLFGWSWRLITPSASYNVKNAWSFLSIFPVCQNKFSVSQGLNLCIKKNKSCVKSQWLLSAGMTKLFEFIQQEGSFCAVSDHFCFCCYWFWTGH